MNRDQRSSLRGALRERYPWAADPVIGPSAVEAGECDRCGTEPRLVQTCGPGPHVFLGRACTLAAADDAWCDGHVEQGCAARSVVAGLPPEADVVARLWWVATGEIALDPALAGSVATLGVLVG